MQVHLHIHRRHYQPRAHILSELNPSSESDSVKLLHWKYVQKGIRFGTDALLLALDHDHDAPKKITPWFQSYQTLTFCACYDYQSRDSNAFTCSCLSVCMRLWM